MRFDHDFVGREALEKLVASGNHRVMKTLIWNPDDVAEVYKAHIMSGVFAPCRCGKHPQRFVFVDSNLTF